MAELLGDPLERAARLPRTHRHRMSSIAQRVVLDADRLARLLVLRVCGEPGDAWPEEIVRREAAAVRRQVRLGPRLDEHFVTNAAEAWSDISALHKAAYIELCATALARHLVRGNKDGAIIGLPLTYKALLPMNVPASRLLDALRVADNIEPQVMARARALIEEVNSA